MDDTGVVAVNRARAILDGFTEDAPVLTLAQLSQKIAADHKLTVGFMGDAGIFADIL